MDCVWLSEICIYLRLNVLTSLVLEVTGKNFLITIFYIYSPKIMLSHSEDPKRIKPVKTILHDCNVI